MTEHLKVEIERIVEPIKAAVRLKNKFRMELWSHLSELYEEECVSEPDCEAAAARRSLERLGNPNELRARLRDSMTLLNKVIGYGNYWTSPRPDKSFLHEVFRLSLSFYLVAVALIIPFVVADWLSLWGTLLSPKGFDPEKGLFLVTLFSTSVGIATASLIALSTIMERSMAGAAKLTGRSVLIKAFRWSYCSAAVMVLTGLASRLMGHIIMALMLGPENRWTLSFDASGLEVLLIWTVLAAVLFPMGIIYENYFSKRLPDWPYADAE